MKVRTYLQYPRNLCHVTLSVRLYQQQQQHQYSTRNQWCTHNSDWWSKELPNHLINTKIYGQSTSEGSHSCSMQCFFSQFILFLWTYSILLLNLLISFFLFFFFVHSNLSLFYLFFRINQFSSDVIHYFLFLF